MLRFLVGLLFVSSCSLGIHKNGGERTYTYDVEKEYSFEELKEMAPNMVITMSRDPQKGTLEKLFSKDQPPIKRIGIFVFETLLQPTRSGLSGQDKVYLSAQGKQLLTERLLHLWEQSLPITGAGLEYVPVSRMKRTKTFKTDGLEVTDYVLSKRTHIMPDDIFFLPPGKNTAISTTMNARGMRDFSLALVPASELLEGPKFSEHAKHSLNEVAKELRLDAVLVIMSEIHWTAAHIDKHSGEAIPEEASLKIKVTTAVPLSSYNKRLANIGEKRDLPNNTLSYRYHESKLKIPVNLSIDENSQSFEHIERELLNPVLKTYNDMAQMIQLQIVDEIKKTHK